MNDDSTPTQWRAKRFLIFMTLSILCLISMSLTALSKCRAFAIDQCTTKHKDRGGVTEQEDTGSATKQQENEKERERERRSDPVGIRAQWYGFAYANCVEFIRDEVLQW